MSSEHATLDKRKEQLENEYNERKTIHERISKKISSRLETVKDAETREILLLCRDIFNAHQSLAYSLELEVNIQLRYGMSTILAIEHITDAIRGITKIVASLESSTKSSKELDQKVNQLHEQQQKLTEVYDGIMEIVDARKQTLNGMEKGGD